MAELHQQANKLFTCDIAAERWDKNTLLFWDSKSSAKSEIIVLKWSFISDSSEPIKTKQNLTSYMIRKTENVWLLHLVMPVQIFAFLWFIVSMVNPKKMEEWNYG